MICVSHNRILITHLFRTCLLITHKRSEGQVRRSARTQLDNFDAWVRAGEITFNNDEDASLGRSANTQSGTMRSSSELSVGGALAPSTVSALALFFFWASFHLEPRPLPQSCRADFVPSYNYSMESETQTFRSLLGSFSGVGDKIPETPSTD